MPISEDEYDHLSSNEATSSTMSKAELRKTHKPIMEKKRRARINHSLNEIKTLILEALKKDPSRHSKLEKADILEMAVKHLQNVQRQQLAISIASDPTVLQKFKAGFNECSDEISTYINQTDNVDSSLKQRIKNHLQKCMSSVEHLAQFNTFAGLGLPFLTNTGNFFQSANLKTTEATSGDQNNNPRIQIPQGIQLIPSRLPTGEFAFLVPNSNNMPYFIGSEARSHQLNEEDIRPANHRPSAFATVIPSTHSQATSDSLSKSTRLLSPPLSPENSSNNEDVIFVPQNQPRSSSPHGFRPVNPAIQNSLRSAFTSTLNSNAEARKHEIGSGPSLFENLNQMPQSLNQMNQRLNQMPQSINPMSQDNIFSHRQEKAEVKTMKFPIHTYMDKERKIAASSPNKKVHEPLCIITNQSERYKQAQILEESAHLAENLPHGVKRKFHEESQGLLSISSGFYKKTKIIKTGKEFAPYSRFAEESYIPLRQQPTIILTQHSDIEKSDQNLAQLSPQNLSIPPQVSYAQNVVQNVIQNVPQNLAPNVIQSVAQNVAQSAAQTVPQNEALPQLSHSIINFAPKKVYQQYSTVSSSSSTSAIEVTNKDTVPHRNSHIFVKNVVDLTNYHDSSSCDSVRDCTEQSAKNAEQHVGSSKPDDDQGDGNNDMWRPW